MPDDNGLTNGLTKNQVMNIAFTVLVVAMTIGTGYLVVGQLNNVGDYREKAQAYCYQTYGDNDVSNSNAIAGGGLHCDANENDPHLHDVRPQAIDAAHAVNQSGEHLNWRLADMERYKPWHERAFPGFILNILGVMIVLLSIGLVAYGVGGGFPRP